MLKILEIILPAKETAVHDILTEYPVIGVWEHSISNNLKDIKALVHSGKIEAILDHLQRKYSDKKDFRVIVSPVALSIPETTASKKTQNKNPDIERQRGRRVSRHEIYQNITESVSISKIFILLTFLSAVIAAIGIRTDDIIVLIGGMLLAQLLGPSIAVSLGVVMGDVNLIYRAAGTLATGIGISFIIAYIIGFIPGADPNPEFINSRTQINLRDIVLAVVSGIAGALAYTSGLGTTLTGVLVAAAILPPIVVSGLMLGDGNYISAAGALSLIFIYIIGINLSGILTFILQGIKPLSTKSRTKSEQITPLWLIMWILLLIGAAFLIIILPFGS